MNSQNIFHKNYSELDDHFSFNFFTWLNLLFASHTDILIVRWTQIYHIPSFQSLNLSWITFPIKVNILFWLLMSQSAITSTSERIHSSIRPNQSWMDSSTSSFHSFDFKMLDNFGQRLVSWICMRPLISMSQFPLVASSPWVYLS